ncbi:MAG: hypothetical protein IKO49_01985 [Bacilli bacterium]|nr:hypothetical protein [Clostridia bacterium]MBR4618050.1 hypothetical protein [Bacilli bacterium]
MLVEKEQLSASPYYVPDDLFFARRYGAGDPISRDQFFISNPSRLVESTYCAIGNDVDGWELEQFNGNNWNTVLPDSNYSLVITNEGLNALTYVLQGGYQLYFSGIKIIDNVIINPSKPIINWTDNDFISSGNVVFTIGTKNSKHSSSDLNNILKWRYNTATGSLQYTFDLANIGVGAKDDNGNTEWLIGAIALYVKKGNKYVNIGNSSEDEDILFGVASLPSAVKKYADDLDMVGNTLRFHFNTVLNNLGYVANLSIQNENEQSIPEVPNETLLQFRYSPVQQPHNCYLVDNLYGSGVPAIAVPRTTTTENLMTPDWVYFQPSNNILTLPTEGDYFASDVKDYMFVYYCNEDGKYHRAQGEPETVASKEADSSSKGYDIDGYDPTDPSQEPPILTKNTKMPIGLRVGNSIVYAGTIANNQENAIYTYTLTRAAAGKNYRIGDELFLPVTDSLIFKIIVTYTNSDGAISSFKLVGPESGAISLPSNPCIVKAIYDSRSNLKYGEGARFSIKQEKRPQYIWPMDSTWLNQPVYCGYGDNAGKPTLERTDSFIGWCTGTNSIQLALDLRNEASDEIYGTTRYATDCEVRDSYKYIQAAHQTSLTPWTAYNNYLQITKPELDSQPGKILTNPIEVKTFTHFNEVLIGKGVPGFDLKTKDSGGYDTNPYIVDDISFYGVAYRAWYKDIAEYYKSDEYYPAGTLITFGKGINEISIADYECNGIISSKPGYQLGEKRSELDLPVALVGRVPVMFDGNCFPHFGDKIYLSKVKKGCASTVENGKCLGKVIDKSIGTKNLIECVVRIDF